MNPLLTTTSVQETDYLSPADQLIADDGYDPYHRARVCTTVFDLLAAAQSDQLVEYLKPIPVTRLRAAQNAFREIGANRIASALHAAQFSLTRVGVRMPFAQAVATLTAALKAPFEDEDVDLLIAAYSHPRLRRR
jgi:hypothetical protein